MSGKNNNLKKELSIEEKLVRESKTGLDKELVDIYFKQKQLELLEKDFKKMQKDLDDTKKKYNL